MDHQEKGVQFEKLSTCNVSEFGLVPERAESSGELALYAVHKNEFLGIVHKVLEARHQSNSRPLPVLLGGKDVDLLTLSLQVRANGGYDGATADSKWSFLAEKLGFGEECGPVLKLVYAKYLKPLESWTQLITEERNPLLTCESPTRINPWSTNCTENRQPDNWEDVEPFTPVSEKRGVKSAVEVVERQLIDGKKIELYEDPGYCKTTSKRRRQRERLCSTSELQYVVDSSVGSMYVPIFRGKNSFASLLEWIKRIALNPGDPKKGQGPHGSKQDETWVEECKAHACSIRGLLWKRKDSMVGHASGNSSSGLTTHMLPLSLYYQELSKPDKQVLERLRSTQKRVAQYGCYCVFTAEVDQKANGNQVLDSGQPCKKAVEKSSACMTAMNEVATLGDLNFPGWKRIPIGPHFQAHIPPWTTSAKLESTGSPCSSRPCHTCNSECDRWLGTVVWPLQGCKKVVNKKRIGKGRPLGCSCIYPGSYTCVRLHVQVGREKLKSELGEAFEGWGFHDMGETVSDGWSQEEESAFKITVQMNPIASKKNFWDELPVALPSKTTAQLASYYFNVFVLRCMAVKNRIMPESIDSDDNETEFPVIESETYRMMGYEKIEGWMYGNAVNVGKSTPDGSIIDKYGSLNVSWSFLASQSVLVGNGVGNCHLSSGKVLGVNGVIPTFNNG